MLDIIDRYTPKYFEDGLIKKIEIISSSHPLNGWIRRYKKSLENFDLTLCFGVALQLLKLEEELNTIESHDKNLFADIKKFIKQENNYAGFRFETSICNKLINNNRQFRMGECHLGESDFYIQNIPDEIIFECTTFNILRAANLNDLFEKFLKKLNGKKFKPYISKNTFLLVDITNVSHRMLPLAEKEHIAEENWTKIFKDMSETKLENSGYGGVILFETFFDKNIMGLRFSWSKIFFKEVTQEARNFINDLFTNDSQPQKIFIKDKLVPTTA